MTYETHIHGQKILDHHGAVVRVSIHQRMHALRIIKHFLCDHCRVIWRRLPGVPAKCFACGKITENPKL